MDEKQADAAALAAFAGIAVGKAVYGLVGPNGVWSLGQTAAGGGTLGAYGLSLGMGVEEIN